MKKRAEDRYEDVRLFYTTNYDQFGNLKENREVSKSHVNDLAEDMAKDGFNKHYPVVVFEEKNKLYITSGQHRMLAAKKAGVELVYTIIKPDEKQKSILCPEHRGLFLNWDIPGALNYYVQKNIKSYKSFDTFVQSHDFDPRIALQLVIGFDIETGKHLEKDYINQFKAGKFKIARSRLKLADDIAERITDFINSHEGHLRYAKSIAFIRALYLLFNHENFSLKRLQQALRNTPRGFVVQGKWSETLQAMVDIYNGGLKTNSKKIDFPKIFEPLERARRKNRYTV